jgi:hypothetical protein
MQFISLPKKKRQKSTYLSGRQLLSIEKLEETRLAPTVCLSSENTNRRAVWHGVKSDFPVSVFEVTMPVENILAAETNRGRLVAIKFTDLWM